LLFGVCVGSQHRHQQRDAGIRRRPGDGVGALEVVDPTAVYPQDRTVEHREPSGPGAPFDDARKALVGERPESVESLDRALVPVRDAVPDALVHTPTRRPVDKKV
jgi:hypothetical protein